MIADDHDLYRQGMKVVIDPEPDFTIVAHAGSSMEAVARCLEVRPDVMVLGYTVPNADWTRACAVIMESLPRTKILILAGLEDEADLYAALQAGATGYLSKNTPSEQIVEAIRLAHRGQSMIPPRMTSLLIAEFVRLGQGQREEEAPGSRLTDRELEVLRLVARGKVNREIATQLFISENTVKNHVRAMIAKLQVNSRVEAALFAVRHGLVEIES